MKKNLKILNPQNCIGCDLCIFEAQRQLKKVGLDDSLIRILKKADDGFGVMIDPKINMLDAEKIKNICPRCVFDTTEEATDELNG